MQTGGEDNDVEGESDEEERAGEDGAQSSVPPAREDAGGTLGEDDSLMSSLSNNRCDLLWQGIVPKRIFHAFRFQVMLSAFAHTVSF